jgi:hypothetical protein
MSDKIVDLGVPFEARKNLIFYGIAERIEECLEMYKLLGKVFK